jgi:hypothetical protein
MSEIREISIPIVIVAYNRTETLLRLLSSIDNAIIPENTTLIISIDGGGDALVREIANNYIWRFGEKIIKAHKQNLGLRNHIIECGDLALKYDGIILLEDDLYVSPFFYNYVIETSNFFNRDEAISGISLYTHNYCETAQLPFRPISTSKDVFFLQLASSWGQFWSNSHWSSFKEWIGENEDKLNKPDKLVPQAIQDWPNSSWKKLYIRYMINKNKYFVYPYLSLTTNFGDYGAHHSGDNHFQVPILMENKKYNFCKLDESIAVYDAYCELMPHCYQAISPNLAKYDLSIDLYGTKPLNGITSKHIITSKKVKRPIASYGKRMYPHELNPLLNVLGHVFHLSDTENVIKSEYKYSIENVVFYHQLPRWHKNKNNNEESPVLSSNEKQLLMLFSNRFSIPILLSIFYVYKMLIWILKHR